MPLRQGQNDLRACITSANSFKLWVLQTGGSVDRLIAITTWTMTFTPHLKALGSHCCPQAAHWALLHCTHRKDRLKAVCIWFNGQVFSEIDYNSSH